MKNLLITHVADPDGVGSAILVKLLKDEFDIKMCETYEASQYMIDSINNNDFKNYNNIYIVDLGINEEVAQLIEENEELKAKVKLFDHHVSNEGLNKYDWVKIVIKNDKSLTCGTSLFYSYLLENYSDETIRTEAVKDFVELIRQKDTREWETIYNNKDAKKLGDLFGIYGVEKFVKVFLDKLKQPSFVLFTKEEEFVLSLEQKRIDRYIARKEKTMVIKKIDGYNVGIVYADIYKGELAKYLATKYESKIDFAAIINISSGISYRSVKDDINVSLFANKYGGGGHAKSSGGPIPEHITNMIIDEIYKL